MNLLTLLFFATERDEIETKRIAGWLSLKMQDGFANLRLDGNIFWGHQDYWMFQGSGTQECVISICETQMSILQSFWTCGIFHFNSYDIFMKSRL